MSGSTRGGMNCSHKLSPQPGYKGQEDRGSRASHGMGCRCTVVGSVMWGRGALNIHDVCAVAGASPTQGHPTPNPPPPAVPALRRGPDTGK